MLHSGEAHTFTKYTHVEFIPTRLILYRHSYPYHPITILVFHYTVPYKQVTNFTRALQGKCNKLTIYMVMSHVIKIFGANNIKHIIIY